MSDNLGRRVAHSALFATGSSYAIQAVNLVFGIITARLVAPEQFGILALAVTIYAIFERVRLWGMSSLLISKPELTDEDLGTHVLLSGTLSVGVVVLILITRPLLGHLYNPLVLNTLVIVALIRLFDISGLAGMPESYLRRQLRYGTWSRIDLVATILSQLVSVGLALVGGGLYALIARSASYELLYCAQAWLALDRRPYLRWNPPEWWEWIKKGSHMWLYNLGRHIAFSYDDLMVGTLIGERVLGFYSRAYSYAQMPMGVAIGLYVVTLPTYSRLRDDRERLSQMVTLMLEVVGLILFPITVWLAFIAGPLLIFLLGARWAPVVPLLQFLLPFALMRPVLDALASLPIATGHWHIRSIAAVVETVVMLVAGTGLTYLYGAPGAAVAAGLVTGLHLITVYVLYLRHYLDIHYGRALGIPGLSTSLAMAGTLGIRWFIPDTYHALAIVGIETAVFGLAYLALSWLFQRRVLMARAWLIWELVRGHPIAVAE